MISVVTTCNREGWEQTGRRMAQSFRLRWPAEIPLILYAEGFEPDVDGIEVRALPTWQAEFKARHRLRPNANGNGGLRYDFRQDAVKFSHKVAALTDAGMAMQDGILIWLDADTMTHEHVTRDWLDGLFRSDAALAWLDRTNCYPECGFVMFRCSHRAHHELMTAFRGIYASDEVFRLKETHDSFVLQHLVGDMVMRGLMPLPHSLSGEARRWHHPFVGGPLGAKLDHMKGDRKNAGRSSRRDLMRPRAESYWREAR